MSESHDTAERLTRTERGDLQRIAPRKAELLADLEEQLSAKFPANDPRWATVTSEAQKAVAQANDVIRGICQDEGVPLERIPEPSQLMCPVTLDEVEAERQAAKVDRAHKHRQVAARFESQSGLTG